MQKIAIVATFVIWILLANVWTKYFYASITSSEFWNKSNTGASWFDIAIPTYNGYNTESWSINIFAWEALTNINAIWFKIKYSPSEIIFKQNIDSFDSFRPDMLDIDVDNINWILEINIINSDAFTINKNSDFVKIEWIINKNLIEWDKINLEISNVEIIDSNLQISQWKWRDWTINIIDNPNLVENLLTPENAIATRITWAIIYFDDYLESIWTITWITVSNIIKNWKTVSFETNALNPWEIYQLNLSWFDWNTQNWLKINNTFIAWYKEDWVSITFDQQITKNTIKIWFDTNTLSKDEIENPTNYTFYNLNNVSSELNISSISLTVDKALITFEKRLEMGSRYILIADWISEMSSNKIISFNANNTWEISIYSITPNSCDTNWCNTTISWDNFENNIAKIFVWNEEINLLNSQDNQTINIDIPSLNAWIHDITIEDVNWKKISLKQAFTITEDFFEQITVLSSESYAAPSKILNNNDMTTTLWVAIEWSLWVSAINNVTIDLRPLWYWATNSMEKSAIVNNKVWFKLENVKAFQTTHLSWTWINLTVTAEDTNGLKSEWTIQLEVTNNLISSEAPEVLDISIVYKKESREIEVYAKVTDKDWILDVETISADLTSLWLWYQILHPIDSTSQNQDQSSSNTENDLWANIFNSRNEKTTSIFALSSPLKIPSDKSTWKYNIIVDAYDRTWGEWTLSLEFDFKWWTHPEFVKKYHSASKNDPLNDFVHLSRYSIPKDWVTAFDMSVIIKDEDWIDDIVEVRADITNLWWTVAIFERQWEQRWVDYSSVKTWIFSVKDITIPGHIIPWWREFQIIATDKQWNESMIRAEVKITDWDELNKWSEILSEKSYTKPAILINDWETRFSIFTFVQSNWNEIDSLIVNLWNIAKFVWNFEHSDSAYCKNQTENILCLKPAIIEWVDWQWFTIDDIVIPNTTDPSSERYKVETIIVEKGWRKITWNTYLSIWDWGLPNRSYASTKLQMSISTDDDQIQLVFTNPLEDREIKSSMFKITSADDISDMLAIKEIKINSDSNILSLSTSKQKAWKKYTIIADSKRLWLQDDLFTDNHKNFYWYDKDDLPPQLVWIETESKTRIALTFDQWILPSSIWNTSDHFEIFTRENESKELKVLSHWFSPANNKILYISTKDQTRNQNYMIRVKNVLSAAWVPVGGYKRKFSNYSKTKYFWITKQFTGFNMLASAEERNKSAFELSNPTKGKCINFLDFTMFSQDYKKWVPSSDYFDYDYNNKIDFKDFTMFSTQYWKCGENEISNNANEEDEEDEDLSGQCDSTVVWTPDAKNPSCDSFFIWYQYENDTNTCIEKWVTWCTFETPFSNIKECQSSCVKTEIETIEEEEQIHPSAEEIQYNEEEFENFEEELWYPEEEFENYEEETEIEETFNQINNKELAPEHLSNLFN